MINVHIYVDSLGAQKTICLGIVEVKNHKSDSIYTAVKDTLEKYDQKIENVGFINTDNVSANLKAFR